jgi:hypothetical protein
MSEDNYRVLYTQERFPVFQNRMYDTALEARNCPRGDVRLVEDLTSGLVFNQAFRPELMIYDANYQNEQGTSPAFKVHLDMVADIVAQRLGKEDLVEVGCGKGLFMEMLLAQGVDITGFDPAYEGSNPRVQRRYFEPGSGIRAKGLILRHVLEHIRDPYEFLSQLLNANNGEGRIYIEVPCFDWICNRRAWFDVFYEHVNYFRLSDFHRMFGSVIESGRLFGGQYLYVVADLASLRRPTIDLTDRADFPDNFTAGLAEPKRAETGQVAIWGGASKGVIFSMLKERMGQPVNVVIDINPAKQGRYLAATGLVVRSPESALETLPAGSTIYVMNSNYLDEVKSMSKNAYVYVGVDS